MKKGRGSKRKAASQCNTVSILFSEAFLLFSCNLAGSLYIRLYVYRSCKSDEIFVELFFFITSEMYSLRHDIRISVCKS